MVNDGGTHRATSDGAGGTHRATSDGAGGTHRATSDGAGEMHRATRDGEDAAGTPCDGATPSLQRPNEFEDGAVLRRNGGFVLPFDSPAIGKRQRRRYFR